MAVLVAGAAGLGVAGLVGAHAATPQTLVLKATADTYVSLANPTTSYAGDPSLYATSMPRNTRTTFLEFTVPTGVTVDGADLVLTRDNHHLPSTTVSVSLASGLLPATVNAKDAPAAGTKLDTQSVSSASKTVTFDVSKGVTKPGTYDFVVTSPVTADVARFLSSDSGSANVPVLRVSYTPVQVAAPAPTPTPTVTTPPPVAVTTPPAPVSTPTPTKTVAPPAPVVVPPVSTCSVSAILVPSCGAWLGVAPAALTTVPRDVALADFESRLGHAVDIAHTYHVGGELFPNATEIGWATDPVNPRMLLINWKPELGRSWAQVAAGDATVDAGIDAEAAYIKAHFPYKFFLAIHHEPENEVIATAGSGFTATDYAAMYRHVALRLRADGVSNAVFVMDFMGAPKWGTAPWLAQLYPGSDVVDWVAFDPYATADDGYKGGTFADMLNRGANSTYPGMYKWLTTNFPGKPVMLGEWGEAESTTSQMANKPAFFSAIPSELAAFPALKALVYFDSPHALAGDTETNTTAASQTAFNSMFGTSMFAHQGVLTK